VTTHRLAPLLTPRSIALVGASPKPDTQGNNMVRELVRSGFKGTVYAVNPNYSEIEGIRCFPSLLDLPEAVDLVSLGVANHRLEEQFRAAAKLGARAAVVFASGYLENDAEPKLLERLAAIAREAGMEVCGGNCMGFNNLEAGVNVAAFPVPDGLEPGPIAFITHSGTVYGELVNIDRRLRFNLTVSSGQEIVTTTDAYMDYALDQASTKVIALFIETVRNPAAFIAALEKARERDVPVVALKVGRTEEAARLAASHSGAIAGNDAAYQAVFDRFGVVRVASTHELAATLILFSGPRRPKKGGFACILDSGGIREMAIDLAQEAGVPFAKISAETTAILASRLEYGLEPVNPLDAWGTGRDYMNIFNDCMAALANDPDTGMVGFIGDIAWAPDLTGGYPRNCLAALERTDRPVVAINDMARGGNDTAVALCKAGVPLIDGTEMALKAIRHAFDHRDARARPAIVPPAPAADGVVKHWRARLAQATPLDEAEALALLADYGIGTVPVRVVDTDGEAEAAAIELGFPVALKTAMPGIAHKSDVGGVRLGLANGRAVLGAYRDLARRLGPRVLVAAMAEKGVEMALGLVRDPQFGPLVMVGAGGVLIELLKDAVYALPPCDAAEGRRMIDRLRSRPLLEGARGGSKGNVDVLAAAIAHLSRLALDLGDLVAEVDVNPIIVGPRTAVAVDALVVTRAAKR
jgi:acyl-CoA synthetase (NDP forming)